MDLTMDEQQPESSPGEVSGDTVNPQANETPAAAQEPQHETTPAPSADAEPPKPDERPRDERGRFAESKDTAPAKPDPVEEAKARLIRKDTAPKPTAKPEAKPATNPGQKPAPQPSDKAQPPNPATAQPRDLTPEELAALKPKTRERIEHVTRENARLRQEVEQFAGIAKDPVVGEFQKIIKEHQLGEDLGFVPPDHLAGIVRVQASLNRAALAMEQGRRPAKADLDVIGAVHKQVNTLAETYGLSSKSAPPAPTLEPFKGELPPNLRDLVEVYGVPEEDVRMLAAAKAAKQQPPPSPAAPPQMPQAAPPQAQAEGVDMDQLYASRLRAELVREGVQATHLRAHMIALQPLMSREVTRRFPTVPPAQAAAVYNALPPQERFEIALAAHRASAARPPAPIPPAPRGSPAGTPPTRRTAAPSDDPVQEAMARLIRPEE